MVWRHENRRARAAIAAAEGWLACPCEEHKPSNEIGVSELAWREAYWDRLGALIGGRAAQFGWILTSASKLLGEDKVRGIVRNELAPLLTS